MIHLGATAQSMILARLGTFADVFNRSTVAGTINIFDLETGRQLFVTRGRLPVLSADRTELGVHQEESIDIYDIRSRIHLTTVALKQNSESLLSRRITILRRLTKE